jgi:hypothetical protein
MSGDTRQSRLITIGLALLSVLIAIFATMAILDGTANAGSQSPIAGDPPIYRAIASEILDGEIPYFDIKVEHLPGALVPMVAIAGISRLTGISFTTIWPFAMGAVFVVSVWIAGGLSSNFRAGRRYLLLSFPLLPLVLFRVEPWLMLWVIASLSFAFRSEWPRSSLSTLIASLTKGWPIILLALPFRSGRRRVAVWTGLVAALLLVFISLLPGFREGRAFEGIHTETVIGSLLLVFRGFSGADPQIIGVAGAAYEAAGAWAVALNLLVGLPFVLLGFRAIFQNDGIEAQTRAIGLVVLGIILGSPLFSAQFVFWLVPFVLFLVLRFRVIYIAASIMTLATIVWWDPTEVAWSALVLGRNGMLLMLAVIWGFWLHNNERRQRDLEHVA